MNDKRRKKIDRKVTSESEGKEVGRKQLKIQQRQQLKKKRKEK